MHTTSPSQNRKQTISFNELHTFLQSTQQNRDRQHNVTGALVPLAASHSLIAALHVVIVFVQRLQNGGRRNEMVARFASVKSSLPIAKDSRWGWLTDSLTKENLENSLAIAKDSRWGWLTDSVTEKNSATWTAIATDSHSKTGVPSAPSPHSPLASDCLRAWPRSLAACGK